MKKLTGQKDSRMGGIGALNVILSVSDGSLQKEQENNILNIWYL